MAFLGVHVENGRFHANILEFVLKYDNLNKTTRTI